VGIDAHYRKPMNFAELEQIKRSPSRPPFPRSQEKAGGQ